MDRDVTKIQKLLDEILLLINSSDDKEWGKSIEYFYKKSFEDDLVLSDFSREISEIYGGMGSFNDLILYKNGGVAIAETNRLDMLRSELFSSIKRLF